MEKVCITGFRGWTPMVSGHWMDTVGDRAFTAAGSRLWNSLPPDIRSAQTLPVFCNRLKTYLVSKCFPT